MDEFDEEREPALPTPPKAPGYRLLVRFPEEMRDDLKALAEQDHQSINGLVVSTMRDEILEWQENSELFTPDPSRRQYRVTFELELDESLSDSAIDAREPINQLLRRIKGLAMGLKLKVFDERLTRHATHHVPLHDSDSDTPFDPIRWRAPAVRPSSSWPSAPSAPDFHYTSDPYTYTSGTTTTAGPVEVVETGSARPLDPAGLTLHSDAEELKEIMREPSSSEKLKMELDASILKYGARPLGDEDAD